jgi:signal transduction histidine kinase
MYVICAQLLIAAAALQAQPEGAATPGTPRPQARRPAILMISPDDPDQPYIQPIIQGFREGLTTAPEAPTLDLEFFDQIRFGDRQAYGGEFIEWLHRKYSRDRLDLIVATQQQTLQLLAERPGSPWNGLPVVYGSLGNLTIDISKTHPTASGVVMENFFPLTLQGIKAAVPETSRIALIYGASVAIRERASWFAAQLPAQGFDVLDLGGLAIDDIRARVAALPPGTVPLMLQFPLDGSGRRFAPGEACALISAAANRPLFVNNGFEMGCGMVAAPALDFNTFGRELAAQSLRRLQGAPAETVTIPVSRYARLAFDWRQVERWGIDVSRLPPGSEVRFRVPTAWELYRSYIVTTLSVVGVQTLLIAGLLIHRRKRHKAEIALRVTSDRNRELAAGLMTAQEEERTRIARELHDDVGQRVASISIALSGVKRKIGPRDDGVEDELSTLLQETMGLSKDLRDLSHKLHPGALEHVGLVEALKARCEELTFEARVIARVDVAHGWSEVPYDIGVCLYRVAQEALRNVTTHARATTAQIALARQNGHVVMRVTDDGRGFDVNGAAGRRGLGLVSMSERVRMLGGRFEVQAAQNTGTVVVATLPIGEKP